MGAGPQDGSSRQRRIQKSDLSPRLLLQSQFQLCAQARFLVEFCFVLVNPSLEGQGSPCLPYHHGILPGMSIAFAGTGLSFETFNKGHGSYYLDGLSRQSSE